MNVWKISISPWSVPLKLFLAILVDIIYAALWMYQDNPSVVKEVLSENLSNYKRVYATWISSFEIDMDWMDLLIVVINVSSSTVEPRSKQSNASMSRFLVL
jgi:hypothetical protein